MLIRNIPDMPQLNLCAQKTLRTPPACPVQKPKREIQENLIWPNARISSGMDTATRSRFEAFQAQKEAGKRV